MTIPLELAEAALAEFTALAESGFDAFETRDFLTRYADFLRRTLALRVALERSLATPPPPDDPQAILRRALEAADILIRLQREQHHSSPQLVKFREEWQRKREAAGRILLRQRVADLPVTKD